MKAMENGSTVICPAGILKPEHSEFIGAEIIPKLAVGTAWSYKGEKMQNEPFRYLPAKLTTGRAIASLPDSSPVVIEKAYGQGSLISCMIPWFEGAPLPVSNLAVKIFDNEISKVQPARVEGLPIEFLSTKTSDCFNVVLSNNSGSEWKGTVIAQLPDSKFKSCSELLTGHKLNSKYRKDKNGEVFITVPAYEVKVISWNRN